MNTPPIGAMAWGAQNIKYRVLDITGSMITLATPMGAKQMPLERVVGWSPPEVILCKVCDNPVTIPGLDQCFCSNCNKWVFGKWEQ